ncbi:integrase [Brevundimonas phage vB_BpoS-Papperlapapp]|nr:integrase [Brevundimonas phage vB_BpoS-Papperlapapp]
MATKRAQTLTGQQFKAALKITRTSDSPLRDEAALRLSFFAGLRASEIAKLRWRTNVLDASGKVRSTLAITGDVGKRSVERLIPIEPELASVLQRLRKARPEDEYVFYALHNYMPPKAKAADGTVKLTRAKKRVSTIANDYVPGSVTPNAVVQWFRRLYAKASLDGATSHSGRRTFGTVRARMANQKKCSILDVQKLMGHKRLETTAAYIEPSDYQRDLVNVANW